MQKKDKASAQINMELVQQIAGVQKAMASVQKELIRGVCNSGEMNLQAQCTGSFVSRSTSPYARCVKLDHVVQNEMPLGGASGGTDESFPDESSLFDQVKFLRFFWSFFRHLLKTPTGPAVM